MKASACDTTRPIPKRSRPLYATATRPILNLTDLLKGSDMKRTSRRTVLLKGGDMKRTSRETALLKGRNTRTIQHAIKASEMSAGFERSRYWSGPPVRLTKCAAD